MLVVIGAVVLVPTAAGRDEDGRAARIFKHGCARSRLRQFQKNGETATASTFPGVESQSRKLAGSQWGRLALTLIGRLAALNDADVT